MFRWENESQLAQLAHDKSMAQALENKLTFEVKRDEDLYFSSQYSKSGTPLSALVLTMVQNNIMKATYYKHQVFMDCSIHDAVNNACIVLGENEESFAPYLRDKGMEVEIYLQ
jgi:hypothetical protein